MFLTINFLFFTINFLQQINTNLSFSVFKLFNIYMKFFCVLKIYTIFRLLLLFSTDFDFLVLFSNFSWCNFFYLFHPNSNFNLFDWFLYVWCRGVVVITTAQLHLTKRELSFCVGRRFTMVRISENGPGWIKF